MKLADFGLAIEVEGEQQAWFGEIVPTVVHRRVLWIPVLLVTLLVIVSD